jgi:hypothetical protein
MVGTANIVHLASGDASSGSIAFSAMLSGAPMEDIALVIADYSAEVG